MLTLLTLKQFGTMDLGISLPSEWCGCVLNYRDVFYKNFILSIENSLEYMPLCTFDRSDGKFISLWFESKGGVFNLYLNEYALLDRLVCDYGIKMIGL